MFKKLARYKATNHILNFIISIIYVFNNKKRKKLRDDIRTIYNNYKKLPWANHINEKYSDCYCFFSRHGIGDVFFVASLMKEFKKIHNAKIVYFTEKKYLVQFLKAFPSIDEVVFDKNFKLLQQEQTMQKHPQKGCINKLFFPYRGTKETRTFSDNYNNLLDLPLDTNRELPIVTDKNIEKAKEEFKKLKLEPNKTILVIPDAAMFDYRIIADDFWAKLTKTLRNNGYEVVFNTKLKEFKKYKNTFLPIMDFVVFAQRVKYIISFRSGICDLMVGMGIYNLSVLYPPNLEVIWADATNFHNLHLYHTLASDNEFENMFNIHSLNNIFKINDIEEIIYDYNNEKIIKQIIYSCNNEI